MLKRSDENATLLILNVSFNSRINDFSRRLNNLNTVRGENMIQNLE